MKNNESGFTLIEVLIASAILVALIAGVFGITANMTKTGIATVSQKSTCQIEAERILGRFKEKGLIRAEYHYAVPRTGAITGIPSGNDVLGTSPTEQGLTSAIRWPNNRRIITGSAPWRVRPSVQLMGLMSTLEALYNANGTYCTGNSNKGIAGNASGADMFEDVSASASDLNATSVAARSFIRIQRYNGSTEATNCVGAGSVSVRPSRTNENVSVAAQLNNPNRINEGIGGYYSSARPVASQPSADVPAANIGFVVTARIEYRNRQGVDTSCQVQERFIYGVEDLQPDKLVVNDIDNQPNDVPEGINNTIRTSNNANTSAGTNNGLMSTSLAQEIDGDYTLGANNNMAWWRACDAGGVSGTIRARVENLSPSGVYMCRNLSSQRNLPASRTGNYNPPGTRRLVQTIQSTELSMKPYYASQISASSNGFMAGMAYPEFNTYCHGFNSGFYNCRGHLFFSYDNGSEGNNLFSNQLRRIGNYRYPYPRAASLIGSRNWVPCARMASVNVCGRTPVAGYPRLVSGANDTVSMEFAYNNLPEGCDVHIQVAEVTPAYNVVAKDIREYIQERAPGNWLCHNNNAQNKDFSPYPDTHPSYNDFSHLVGWANSPPTVTVPPGGWFFVCGARPSNFSNGCPGGLSTGIGNACCLRYPDDVHPGTYRSHINP